MSEPTDTLDHEAVEWCGQIFPQPFIWCGSIEERTLPNVARCHREALAPSGWLPTPANINALPEPVRKYIHDVETRCDPAGYVAELALLRDQNENLQALLDNTKTETPT